MNKKDYKSKLLEMLCFCSALLLVFIFLGILSELVLGSLPAFKTFGYAFIYNNDWNPVTKDFGALGCFIGTLSTSFIALFIGIPVSLSTVIFIHKIAPSSIRRTLRTLIDLLASIPSIIFGMWGRFELAPFVGGYIQPWCLKYLGQTPWLATFFQGGHFGVGLFTAGLVLALMITPLMASIIYDVFESVPKIIQESAYALGTTTWETVTSILIPYGKHPIIGAVILGLGRAIGETMAVSFVIGNAHTLTAELFAPTNSITSVLANEFLEADENIYIASLVALGLILFILSTIVVICSRLLLKFSFKKMIQY
jgi:phosphate transport system permease protein